MLQRVTICLILVTMILSACGPSATPTRRPPSTLTPTIGLPTATPLPTDTPLWFRETVLYKIAPRSFYDSNGDGVGDLNGITQKLDYIRSLGVTTLWITPIYSTTSISGYDVVDHFSVAPDLGIQQDMVQLVNEAHARSIRVVMELVAGRTSKQHPFFQDAYRNPDSFYSDWYLWENETHTVYKSASNDNSDPLLNMDNPIVQRYMLEIARYWIDLDEDGNLTNGIDGFAAQAQFSSPEFWAALRKESKATHPDFLLLGYIPEGTLEQIATYYAGQFDALLDAPLHAILAGNPDRNGDGLLNGQGALTLIRQQLENEIQGLPSSAQLVRYLNNDNTNRIASEVRELSRAKQAAALLLTLPSTPMIYYGEEIGMKGSLGSGAYANIYRQEPMDWYTAETGPGMPIWFKPQNRNNRANDGISVEEQDGQPNSLLQFYRNLIFQRQSSSALNLGGLEPATTDKCSKCLAYWRWDEKDIYLVLFNFANTTQATTIDFISVPRFIRGAGEDVLRGGVVNVPSNGRYTLTLEANDVRLLHWGQP